MDKTTQNYLLGLLEIIKTCHLDPDPLAHQKIETALNYARTTLENISVDDLETLGHIAMCIRLKLRKDQSGRTMPPEDDRVLARIARGQKALALVTKRMDEIRKS